VKALRSGAAVIMRTATDDAAWVMRLQATTERLKQREAATQAGVGAQEVTGPDPAAQGLGPTETVVPSGAGLEAPDSGGPEPGLTATTQASVKAAEAETSVRDTGRADVGEEQEVVEARRRRGRRRRGRRSHNRSRTSRRSRRSWWSGGRSHHRPSSRRRCR
jgi:hypothetical protein